MHSGRALVANEDSNLRPARAQLTEPRYPVPQVRWCGRGERATASPMPIIVKGKPFELVLCAAQWAVDGVECAPQGVERLAGGGHDFVGVIPGVLHEPAAPRGAMGLVGFFVHGEIS